MRSTLESTAIGLICAIPIALFTIPARADALGTLHVELAERAAVSVDDLRVESNDTQLSPGSHQLWVKFANGSHDQRCSDGFDGGCYGDLNAFAAFGPTWSLLSFRFGTRSQYDVAFNQNITVISADAFTDAIPVFYGQSLTFGGLFF